MRCNFNKAWILLLTLITTQNSLAETPQQKVDKLLASEQAHLEEPFPYRINLFKQGEVSKNTAGLQISEKASQLKSNDFGLLYYYELISKAMRVPHWHSNASEIGIVLSGNMRVTLYEGNGKSIVYTVKPNSTWVIPKGKLHSLENIGEEKLRFIVSYDAPIAGERDFVTAWSSLPHAILASCLGLTEGDIDKIQQSTANLISQFEPSLKPIFHIENSDLSLDLDSKKPLFQNEWGRIMRLDNRYNEHLGHNAIQKTIIKAGGLRIPHWYTSGNVLLYVDKGQGFFTLMNDEGSVYRAIIQPGDVVAIPSGYFHSFLNTKTEDLVIYEIFYHALHSQEVNLINGVQHFSPHVMQGATGLPLSTIEKINQKNSSIYIDKF